jgi:hypothetical protein
MKTLLLAERFRVRPDQCVPEWERRLLLRDYDFCLKWWHVSSRLGVFREGSGSPRLQEIGVPVGDCVSANLLPPHHVSGWWNAATARYVAETWRPYIELHHRVILVGVRTAHAVLGHKVKVLQSGIYHHHPWICVPHPSGRNRFWNDVANEASAYIEVKKWLDKTSAGS